MHSGGISAVAMATPGITLLALSFLVEPMQPARPPQKAISTSQMVGWVRASSSEVELEMGVMLKYSVEVSRLMAICSRKPKK